MTSTGRLGFAIVDDLMVLRAPASFQSGNSASSDKAGKLPGYFAALRPASYASAIGGPSRSLRARGREVIEMTSEVRTQDRAFTVHVLIFQT